MNLERAIAIATEAHTGQTDKARAPYILHPLRVMRARDSDDARIVAVLHDVVEDCPGWTFERLEAHGSLGYRPPAPEVFIPQSARAAALPRPASPPALAPKPIMH